MAISLIILELSRRVVIAAALACDPRLTALFAPPSAPNLGHYEVCTTGLALEQVLSDPASFHIGHGGDFHASPVELFESLDAFGPWARYDRSALARLYGGRRVRLVRGWVEGAGQFESVTLLSPYPDPTFMTLQPGTMIIRWIRSR